MTRPRPKDKVGARAAQVATQGPHRERPEPDHFAGAPVVVPIPDKRRRLAAGKLGMRLFIVTLAVLFASSILAFLFVRFAPPGDQTTASAWSSAGVPRELWLSTAFLLASSLFLERGVRSLRSGARDRGLQALRGAGALALAFLLVQSWCWVRVAKELGIVAAGGEPESSPLAVWSFIVLTALHALHVIGGLVPFALVLRRIASGRYTASAHDGLLHLRLYWHFLGVVWLALFATLALLLGPG